MTQPLVSVVLIFFNARDYLEEAIESVLHQTYRNWELLLVDDGSSDGSTEIALTIARSHPGRIEYLEHPGHANRGISASRNAGITRAHGEYVALLDADDVWKPEKLTEQVAILERQPTAGLVYGAPTYWYSWRDDRRPDYRRPLGVAPNRLHPPRFLLAQALRSRAPTGCPSDLLVRRSLALEVGGFDEGVDAFEDQAFLAKIYLRAPVYVSGASWLLYRQHESSVVAELAASGRKYEAGLRYFAWLEHYLSEHEIDERAVTRALRHKRRRYSHPAYDRLYRTRLRVEERIGRRIDSRRRAP